MNSDWQAFLVSKHAKIENNHVQTFGKSIDEEQQAYGNMVLADLSHYAVVKASGEDTAEFLQGQFTNDTKQVNESISQLSAYCNPKGRILANFRIFKRDNDFFLRMHADLLDAFLKRLRMFIMRSKVELIDSSEELTRMGIAGDKAGSKLETIFTSVPENPDESITENSITLIRLSGNTSRFEAYGPLDEIKTLWEKLESDATAIGKNSWDLLTIRAGIPEIVADTVEAFVPQMINLQAINSLSFTKGCYPGQEVVARMHYLGKVKRRLYLAQCNTETLPQPGQAIMTSDESAEKAGQVVMASWSGDKTAAFLAVLIIDKAENEALHVGSANGASVEILDLPYTLEKEQKS